MGHKCAREKPVPLPTGLLQSLATLSNFRRIEFGTVCEAKSSLRYIAAISPNPLNPMIAGWEPGKLLNPICEKQVADC